MMHKSNFKVMLWLDCRAFQNKDVLQENNGFILMNPELELEYDKFKETVVTGLYYVPVNDLLCYWHQMDNPRATVHTEFGKEYFLMSQDKLDNFFLWMKRSREEQKLVKIIESVDEVGENFYCC